MHVIQYLSEAVHAAHSLGAVHSASAEFASAPPCCDIINLSRFLRSSAACMGSAGKNVATGTVLSLPNLVLCSRPNTVLQCAGL
jgi:hypothetical protein